MNALVVEGGKLGGSRLFDSKNLSRVPDVKVVPVRRMPLCCSPM